MKVLIACRGPIAEEALRVIQELGMTKPDVIVSRQEWLDNLESRAPWLTHRERFARVHRVDEYLDMDHIMQIALANHIDAIYVGYGFLAENADFARKCERAGVRFVGPSSEVLYRVGSKQKGRSLCKKLGIPVVPGVEILEKTSQDLDTALPEVLSQAQLQGISLFSEEEIMATITKEMNALWQKYGTVPIRIKASTGGGGKGQRIVSHPEEITKAVREVWSEIGASCGSGNKAVVLERNLVGPRHLEVQVFGDGKNVVHFGVRDCSTQTMFYQKLIEIARHEGQLEELRKTLAPDSPLHADLEKEAALLRSLASAAVKLCQAIGYRGAGTVEFLVDEAYNFYFMEVNARIQVEHGVSEEVARVKGKKISLVAEQLRIISGEEIGYSQDDITFQGYALETRISLLDSTMLRPAPGATIERLAFPKGEGIRIEDGGTEAALACHRSVVSPPSYDANVTLNIYSGSTWDEVLTKAITNLRSSDIHGRSLATTIPFHIAVLTWLRQNQPFVRVTTSFVETYLCLVARLKSRLEAEIPKVADMASRFPNASQYIIACDVFSSLCSEPSLGAAFFWEHHEAMEPLEVLALFVSHFDLPLWQEDRAYLNEAQEFFQAMEGLRRKLNIGRAIFYEGLDKGANAEILCLAQVIADAEKVSTDQALATLQKRYHGYRQDLQQVIARFIDILSECEFAALRRDEKGTKLLFPKSLEEGAARQKSLAGACSSGAASGEAKGVVISPILGIFYRSPKPGAPPFVAVQQRVKQGQALAVVGAMKVFSEIQAPHDGVVQEICAGNETLVSPGQKLMVLQG
jgi:acetyl-CoA carboxylase biotin carboxylase subunit